MPQTIHKITLIDCLVLQYFQTFSLLNVIFEETFKQPQMWIIVYAFTMSFILYHLTFVDSAVLENYNAVS